MTNKKTKKKLEIVSGKITEIKKKQKKFGGGDEIEAECVLIEKAENGYIVRVLTPFFSESEEALVETVMVFNERSELIRFINENI